MSRQPIGGSRRRRYRVIRTFEATPFREEPFDSGDEYYEPLAKIEVGSIISADLDAERSPFGEIVIVFSRGDSWFYVRKTDLSTSIKLVADESAALGQH